MLWGCQMPLKLQPIFLSGSMGFWGGVLIFPHLRSAGLYWEQCLEPEWTPHPKWGLQKIINKTIPVFLDPWKSSSLTRNSFQLFFFQSRVLTIKSKIWDLVTEDQPLNSTWDKARLKAERKDYDYRLNEWFLLTIHCSFPSAYKIQVFETIFFVSLPPSMGIRCSTSGRIAR